MDFANLTQQEKDVLIGCLTLNKINMEARLKELPTGNLSEDRQGILDTTKDLLKKVNQ